MNLKFLKSEKLIQHIQICSHLLEYPQERTDEKLNIIMLLRCLCDGRSIDDFPDSDLVEHIKKNPLPTIEDIETELHEKCSRTEDYVPLVRMLFNEWKGKLYRLDCFQLYKSPNLDNDMLMGEIIRVNYEITTLFEKSSNNSGVPIPDLYRKDDIASIIESWNSTDQELSNIDCAEKEYSKGLLELFHNHIDLIEALTGKSDDDIASLIKTWSSRKDNFGKPLIENPNNRMQRAFANELKQNGLIKLSVESFRKKL